MRNIGTIVLATFVVASAGTYLLGSSLEAPFSGGQGQIEPCRAEAIDPQGSTISRGELMSSPIDAYTKFQLCDGTMLYLDSNTQIKLTQYRNPKAVTETQLELIQGRVIVDGVANVRARNLVGQVRGAGCEFVHYSWRDELDVTAFADQACVIESLQNNPLAFQTIRFNTFGKGDPILSVSPFASNTSAARLFYLWTGLQFE
ncbi:MAG: hypothetical protein AAB776_04335 [Patescibacteria group bacterium]